MTTAAPIACDLAAIPDGERARYHALRAQVLGSVEGAAETDGGFALRVDAARAPLPAVAEWIAYERLCCPFLVFHLTVGGDGPVTLEIGGAEGVKEFLRGEIVEIERARLRPPASLIRGR